MALVWLLNVYIRPTLLFNAKCVYVTMPSVVFALLVIYLFICSLSTLSPSGAYRQPPFLRFDIRHFILFYIVNMCWKLRFYLLTLISDHRPYCVYERFLYFPIRGPGLLSVL